MIVAEISKVDMNRLLKKINPVTRDLVIRASLYKSAQFIAGWIKDRRLSGPRPKFLGVITGRLRSSITASPVSKTGFTYTAKIGTNVVYAHRHEEGTYGMPKRPFLKPALEDKQNIQGVKDDLTKAIRKALAV